MNLNSNGKIVSVLNNAQFLLIQICILKLNFYLFIYFKDCFEDNSYLNNLKGSSTKYVPGWKIDVDTDSQNSAYNEDCMTDNNWHGYTSNDAVGSIKTKLRGCGSAQLNFGNCFIKGITQVTLDEKIIGIASAETMTKIIEFDFEDGVILELQELYTGIIVFNDLTITKCKSCPPHYKGITTT